MFIIGGSANVNFYNDVWSSSDTGGTWTQVTAAAAFRARYGHTSVLVPAAGGAYDITVIGGFASDAFGDAWSSRDGATWTNLCTLATCGPSNFGRAYASAVFAPTAGSATAGTILVIGGYDTFSVNQNTVFGSTDGGKTFTVVTSNPGFLPRWQHASIIAPNGAVLVVGGQTSSQAGASSLLNDVYSSMDGGRTWNELYNANNFFFRFPPRIGHSLAIGCRSEIYLVGGSAPPSINYNDVWSSPDNGLTWNQLSNALGAGFPGRNEFELLSNNGVLALVAGSASQAGGVGNSFSNDVYTTQGCTQVYYGYVATASPCQGTCGTGSTTTTYTCYQFYGTYNGQPLSASAGTPADPNSGCPNPVNFQPQQGFFDVFGNFVPGQSFPSPVTTSCPLSSVCTYQYLAQQTSQCTGNCGTGTVTTTYTCYTCVGTYDFFTNPNLQQCTATPAAAGFTGTFCPQAVNSNQFGSLSIGAGTGITLSAAGAAVQTGPCPLSACTTNCVAYVQVGFSNCVGDCNFGQQTSIYGCQSYANVIGDKYNNPGATSGLPYVTNCPNGVVPDQFFSGIVGTPVNSTQCVAAGLTPPTPFTNTCQLPNVCTTYAWGQGICPPCPTYCRPPQLGFGGETVNCEVTCADNLGNTVALSFCETAAVNGARPSATFQCYQPTCITGDPEFVGFLGQKYEIHGVPNQVFNIISSPLLQYNALFVYIGHKSDRACNVSRTHPWTHAGTYLGKLGFQTGSDRILLEAGDCLKGVKTLKVNGKSLAVGEKYEMAVISGQPQSVYFKDQFTVVLQTAEIEATLTNSDLFFNQAVELTPYGEQSPQLHGLLGQTWDEQTLKNDHVIAGSSADYQIQDEDLFGNDFVFNKYQSA